MNRLKTAVSVVAWVVLAFGHRTSAEESIVRITPAAGRFVVTVGDELYCEVDYQSYAKPIVYPIHGPGQIPMTRNHPMQKGVLGETTDHPHHKSMWFGHGDINGVSFWDEKGKTINVTADIVPAAEWPAGPQNQPLIRLQNRLVDANGTEVCRETMLLSFGASDSRRWIDWQISEHAGAEPLVFGDTKEGTAALRVHPNLRPDNHATRDTQAPPAKAINSEGVEGGAIWGKRAKWVDYSGTINGHLVGIAFFDHPQNLRHPTYWHARDYGLFAANPFGLSHFVGEGADGSLTVPAGESLDLRYRVVFHNGDAQEAQIESLYQDYAGQTK